MQKVQITWIDAIGDDGWVSLEDIKKEKPTEHHSVGFLCHETDEFMTISMSYDETEDNMGAWLLIPKPYIKEVIHL